MADLKDSNGQLITDDKANLLNNFFLPVFVNPLPLFDTRYNGTPADVVTLCDIFIQSIKVFCPYILEK